MRIPFTKMQGAGNDFVVLDETRGALHLSTPQYRFLADRHFGVGADQILCVRPAPAQAQAGVEFAYAIYNADGHEVEHCGNGARCFARYVHDRGLSQSNPVRVQTMNRVLDLRLQSDGMVTVNMGPPDFALKNIPFAPGHLAPQTTDSWENWPIVFDLEGLHATSFVAVLSMGNPHAVQRVDDVDTAPVLQAGPQIEKHPCFPQGVNAGFMQVVSRSQIRLRVYERGAGETLACGTGACAAVVAGIKLGWLDNQVQVHMRGGVLSIQWESGQNSAAASVFMTGPATTVYQGEIDIP